TEQKRYFRHTGYMGHERFTAVKTVLSKHPERVIEKAVWGMLPKTTLSRQHVKQMLKVYAGPTHPHAAQQPQPLTLSAGEDACPRSRRSCAGTRSGAARQAWRASI